MELTAAFAVCAIMITVTISLIFICAKRLTVLADLQKEDPPVDVDNIADLYEKGQRLVRDEKLTRGILDRQIGTCMEDAMVEVGRDCGCIKPVTIVPTCRQPKLPMVKRSRVRLKHSKGLIHMNKLKDYYKSEVYMCQAPLQTEFRLYYEAILQEKMGVVVWLSRPNSNVETYIPMRNGEKLMVGDYVLNYELSSKREEYDFYFIRLSRSGTTSESTYTRIAFIVAHCWTLDAKPKHMTKQCDVISVIQCFHDYMSESGLPGLLVHHVVGVNLTAGFVACYIGRQILVDQRKVNIPGICRYIRQHRHCAFTYDKCSVKQLQVVYMVLGSFARTFAYEQAGRLTTTEAEKKLFCKVKNAYPISRLGVSDRSGPLAFKGCLEKSVKRAPTLTISKKSSSESEKYVEISKTLGDKSKTTTKSAVKKEQKTAIDVYIMPFSITDRPIK